jgi:DHA2 family multidrug resistance protein
MTSVAAAHPERRTGRQWLIAPVVAFATFMEVLDFSIANVALVHIAGSLSAGREESTWVLTSFMVANAIALPASGWFASVFGRKRFFLACIAGFSAASLVCGLATSLTWLVVFRVVQGLAGGGLQPVAQSILADAFPPSQRGMAFAMYGISVMFAPAIGPTLGGWITDSFSWHWIFLINVPVGIVLFLLVGVLVDDPEHVEAERRRRRESPIRIDYIGFGLLALGFGSLQFMLDQGQTRDWFASDVILAALVVSVVALVSFVLWDAGREDPILDLRVFRSWNFVVASFLMFALGLAMFTSTVLLPVMVQQLFGYTAMLAGLVISPGAFLIMPVMPLVGRLVARFDPRILILFGLVMASSALFAMTGITMQTDFWTLASIRMHQMIGLAFLFVPITTLAYIGLPRELSNAASTLINLSRNLGASVGIALVTTFVAQRSQHHHARLVEHVAPHDPAYREMADALVRKFETSGAGPADALDRAHAMIARMIDQQSSLMAYIDCFYVQAVAIAALAVLLVVMRGRRQQSAGQAAPIEPPGA